MISIRAAGLADARTIAEISVETWRNTYATLMPADLLAQLSVDRREENWRRHIEERRGFVFIAEREGEVVAFASGGRERTGSEYDGELYAIYVRPSRQGAGVGKALIRACARELLRRGARGMLLWVVKQNPSCHFYRSMGGRADAERTESIGNFEAAEISYVWDCEALAALAGEGPPPQL